MKGTRSGRSSAGGLPRPSLRRRGCPRPPSNSPSSLPADNFQDQMKRELAYREEMVQQLQIVRGEQGLRAPSQPGGGRGPGAGGRPERPLPCRPRPSSSCPPQIPCATSSTRNGRPATPFSRSSKVGGSLYARAPKGSAVGGRTRGSWQESFPALPALRSGRTES